MRIYKPSKNYTKIKNVCRKYDIQNYTVNNDGSLNINGKVDISNRHLIRIPYKFNKVSSDFLCNNNKLKLLDGCPEYVSGDFNCDGNRLTSLENCPKHVKGDFYCKDNKIKYLDWFPEHIGGIIDISENPIFELVGLVPTSRHLLIIKLLKEFDVFQENKIVKTRLKKVLRMSGINKLKRERFKGYKVV